MTRWFRLLIAFALGACSAPPPVPPPPVPPPPVPPAPVAAHRPGDVLHAEAMQGAPAGASATRIVYASTAPDGSAIAVAGFVVAPSGAAPAGGRPVVAWLHATTGVDRACAPSTGPGPFAQVQGLERFLAAGDVVVATDYPGLGAPGVHPYLVGESEARAALDSVRAARNLPGTQAGSLVAVWGHSQGGQAALFTAQLAAAYAPDLRLVAAAAAAPVTDPAALLGTPGRDPLWGGLLSYTVWSWSQRFGAGAAGIVPQADPGVIAAPAKDCLQTADELKKLIADAAPLNGTPVQPDAHWRALLAENAPGATPPAVPVLLAQGSVDPVIPPVLTRAYARLLCGAHVPVRYLAMPGVDHYTIAMVTSDAVAAWIADRFAGAPARDDCPALLRGR
jgi:alpha-beta hydrolase superfamily lysophospholipase